MKFISLIITIFLFFCFFSGCYSDTSTDNQAEISTNNSNNSSPNNSYNDNNNVVTFTVLQSIEISIEKNTIEIGEEISIQAIGVYSDSTEKDITNDVTWISSNESIASISNGYVISNDAGEVTFTAIYDGVESSEIIVTVIYENIDFIVIEGANRVGKSYTIQLNAIAYFLDGSSREITSLVKWRISNISIADISQNGIVSGNEIGTTTVSIKFGELSYSHIIEVEYPRFTMNVINNYGVDIVFELWKGSSLSYDSNAGNVIGYAEKVHPHTDDAQLVTVNTAYPIEFQLDIFDESGYMKDIELLLIIGVVYNNMYIYLGNKLYTYYGEIINARVNEFGLIE